MYFLRYLCNRTLILRTANVCISSRMNRDRHRPVKLIEWVIIVLLSTAILHGCGSNPYQTFHGETMGTYFRVVGNCSPTLTQELLETELEKLTAILSTYEPDSAVSVFNRTLTVGEWMSLDEVLVDVIDIAQQVSAQTNGAFDITVAPLVEIWGFGSTEVIDRPPPDLIAGALKRVNYKLLEIDESTKLVRKHADIQLDLSGLGKGYGVDHIAKLLKQHDCSDFLVDIGGEIRVLGRNDANKPWRIGIEAPDEFGKVQAYVQLSDGAIATSGSYRNYRIFDTVLYPHVIDPRSGLPTSHNLLAVTVYHATAAEADALATALFVMGFDEALEFAEAHDIAIALTIWDSKAEEKRVKYSTAMELLMESRN